jgi:hypothetical protein
MHAPCFDVFCFRIENLAIKATSPFCKAFSVIVIL